MKQLADCIYHVLTAESYSKNYFILRVYIKTTNKYFVFPFSAKGGLVPRVAGLFMKANRNWLNEQIDVIKEFVMSQ